MPRPCLPVCFEWGFAAGELMHCNQRIHLRPRVHRELRSQAGCSRIP